MSDLQDDFQGASYETISLWIFFFYRNCFLKEDSCKDVLESSFVDCGSKLVAYFISELLVNW